MVGEAFCGIQAATSVGGIALVRVCRWPSQSPRSSGATTLAPSTARTATMTTRPCCHATSLRSGTSRRLCSPLLPPAPLLKHLLFLLVRPSRGRSVHSSSRPCLRLSPRPYPAHPHFVPLPTHRLPHSVFCSPDNRATAPPPPPPPAPSMCLQISGVLRGEGRSGRAVRAPPHSHLDAGSLATPPRQERSDCYCLHAPPWLLRKREKKKGGEIGVSSSCFSPDTLTQDPPPPHPVLSRTVLRTCSRGVSCVRAASPQATLHDARVHQRVSKPHYPDGRSRRTGLRRPTLRAHTVYLVNRQSRSWALPLTSTESARETRQVVVGC